jgi:hypothetical protein
MSTNYNPQIVMDGLVLCLDAGNKRSYPGSGISFIDLSGNSNNAILINGPIFNTGNLGSIEFDGINDYFSATLNSINLYCLDIWMYNNYAIPNNETPIGGPTTYQAFAMFNNNPSTGIFLGEWTSAATNEAIHIWSGTTNATYNRYYTPIGWHNLVFNWNGSTYDIWVDNVKTDIYPRESYANLIQNLNNLTIGGRISDYYFSGRTSIVKVYNSALTDSQISQNFNALRGRYGI